MSPSRQRDVGVAVVHRAWPLPSLQLTCDADLVDVSDRPVLVSKEFRDKRGISERSALFWEPLAGLGPGPHWRLIPMRGWPSGRRSNQDPFRDIHRLFRWTFRWTKLSERPCQPDEVCRQQVSKSMNDVDTKKAMAYTWAFLDTCLPIYNMKQQTA
jgi:hypothetical protein